MQLRAINTQRIRIWLLGAGLLWLLLAFASAWQKSATYDEPAHIGSGLAYLHFGDFRMNPEHPSLVKVLAAMPLYLFYRPEMAVTFDDMNLTAWYDGLQNEYGHYLLFHAMGSASDPSADDPRVRLFLARIVPILIGLLGGFLAFEWGRAIARSKLAGLFAALLLWFYPEYLGHSRFVTFDVPTLVGCGAVSWFAFQWWRRPRLANAVGLVVVASVASLIKLPVAVFVAVTFATLMLLALLRCERRRILTTAALGFALLAGGIFAAWSAAGFRFRYVPAGAEVGAPNPFIPPVGGENPTTLQSVVNYLHRQRILPETTLATFAALESFQQRRMFLLGEYSREGWYYYNAVTFLLKTPIPMLIGFALLLALGAARIGRLRRSCTFPWRIERGILFWVPFIFILMLTMKARANIGHRYILFFYLPLCVYLGAYAARWWRFGDRFRRGLVIVLFLGLAGSVATTYPHFATYFHFLVGSPYEGSKYLRDSNVDWGQDLTLLGRTLDRLEIGSFNLAVFGTNRPESFGVEGYRWILPSYPFAVYTPEAVEPDSNLPFAISLNNIDFVPRSIQPDLLLNSIVLYLPPSYSVLNTD